jgi:hypothetical protein
MSKLTIVDLDHADELSSSDRGCIAGGNRCMAEYELSRAYNAFGDIMTGLGDSDRANDYYNAAANVKSGCTYA